MTTLSDRYLLSGDLPLQVTPLREADADVGALCRALAQAAGDVQARLARHGALRFRGFAVQGPEDVERVARAVAPDLKKDYLGTSPRDAVTEYVFNASELPDFFPIPQHCEMSFCAEPPSRVFFACLEPPADGSGETPLCDFRAVWRDLDPEVKRRFQEGGIRIVRNYAGPEAGGGADPTQLKPWPDMFGTTDKTAVETTCRREGFEPIWRPGDALRLVSTQPVARTHPATGETAWHNHVTTFHVGTAAAEYARIAAFRPTERHRGLLKMARALDAELRAKPPEERGMHCTYADGREIPDADLEHVRDVIWQHLVVEPWRRGDVVAVDNFAVAHGRLPYEGPRRIAVCWA